MKSLFFVAICFALLVNTAAAAPPNEKVLKVFNESYTEAAEVKWFEYETYYEAIFRQNTVPVTVRYDFEGNILSTNRRYSGDQLHPFIMGKLRKKFGNKNIFGVTEKVTETDIEYHIVLEDDKGWITVKANGLGDMEVTEKIKKNKE